MATTDQIKALIECHAQGDDDRFYAIALQMAAHAARQGHANVARDLKELVDVARRGVRSRRPVALATPRGELSGLLAVSAPRSRLDEMVLDEELRAAIERVIREQQSAGKIEAHGLSPARKLLLVGPPGTGKTMTAAVLAGELGLSLNVVVLHALITRFMGETAAKLHLVFDTLAKNRGVYLFDEFDAIGSHRATGQDVGEIRRVLNSFLLFLEQDRSRSLIIAATNHPQSLDAALFRRFDAVIEYRRPDQELAVIAVQRRMSLFETDGVDWGRVGVACAGLSYGEITSAADEAAKDAILADTIQISTERLLGAIARRQRTTDNK